MRKTFLLLLCCTLPWVWLSAKSPSYYKKIIEQSEKLYKEGDINSCIELSEKTLYEMEISSDTLSNKYAHLLLICSMCYYQLERYDAALSRMQRCLTIRKKVLKLHDERYIQSAILLAQIHTAIGEDTKSDSIYNLLLLETQEYPRLYYWILSEQVEGYYLNGKLKQVIQCGTEAIITLQNKFENCSERDRMKYSKTVSEYIILICHRIAHAYDKIQDFVSAINWTIWIINFQKEFLHLTDEDCLTEYNNISVFSNAYGDCYNAVRIGRYVMQYREKNKDEEYANSAHTLASAYAHCGNLDSAIVYAESALQTKKILLGENTYSYHRTEGNLAVYYGAKGDYRNAINCSKSTYRFYLDNDITDPTILQNLASLYKFVDHDSATYYRNICFEEYKKEMTNILRELTYKEREVYLFYLLQEIKTLIWPLDFDDCSTFVNSGSYNATSYDIALLINNSCIGAENKIMELIKKSGNDSIFAQYISMRTKLQSLDQNDDIAIYHDTYVSESNIINQYNENLIAFFSITYQDVQKHLSPNDIAIEISHQDNNVEGSYYALVLRKDWDAPKCVIIGNVIHENETEIDSLKNEAELDFMSYSKLQQEIWQAIIDSAQIKEGENIYFSPDGIFYNMPIEYLPTADGRNMSDKYNMYRVSSTRELCYRDTAKTYSTAVLYGGLRYDATPPNLLAQNSSTRGWEESIHESVLSQWRADDRAKYNYLPYTLMEVDSISQTIGNAIQVTTYTDKEGSEESFKSLSGHSPSILHIATHGYYITPTKAEMMSKENLYRYGLTAMDDRPSVIDYSMERTGLLMAGAQHTLRGDSVPQMAEDGILSAKEISHLDLSNTDLVVLSACQTALGDITNDGVAGLQRGFKIAGVKSVLMSLWKVDDAATYLLMKQFYKSLFAGKNKQQALRDAQNYLRSYMVGNEHPYNDIHYWGAFVLLDAIEK